VLLSTLLVIPVLFMDVIQLKYYTTLLAPPPTQPPKPILEVSNYRQPPQPKPKPKLEKPLIVPPPDKPLLVEPPRPKPIERKVEVKIPEMPEPEKPPVRPEPAPPAPKPEVRTGLFTTETSKPTTNLPAARVQTGGFGDPDGIKGEGKPGKIANIASLGSFDMPAGPGAGNGTGGARGSKGIVTGTGFGDGTPAAQGKADSSRAVRQGGFGDAEASKTEAKKRTDTGPPQTPVEILFKPKPDYTEEARKAKLEGEVQVRVLFSAGGDVRVLEVVRGLGRGLDESAVRAAQQIKFKPAQRDGQPVDSTATVRIVFQLAY
jgi:TonB family protein